MHLTTLLASSASAITAIYRGNTIDVSSPSGWGTAQICNSVGFTVLCFDTETQLRDYYTRNGLSIDIDIDINIGSGSSTPRAPYSCPSGYACLYDGENYSGRKLQWSEMGTFDLADWGFADKVSSVYNNRARSVKLTDNKKSLFSAAETRTYNAKTGYTTSCSFSNQANLITLN
ncbi:hypothetical protein HDV00_012219 [Rhizophlyctis rosea]|nr:hypothetical protein HDV00_012219 [Rhizophlyctis rosea]